jgi:hypothetical protein
MELAMTVIAKLAKITASSLCLQTSFALLPARKLSNKD